MNLASLTHATLIAQDDDELARGWLRYQAVKQLKPNQMLALTRSQLLGKDFDELVDKLVITFSKKTL